MAIYTTFFLADPREVPGGFPGWKPPLPAPVRREFRNPTEFGRRQQAIYLGSS
jgi:hypothetical protein